MSPVILKNTKAAGDQYLLEVRGLKIPDGISNGYLYDSYGRMTRLTETITGDQSLVTEWKYDTWGRDSVITYPSGLAITNLYNVDGYLNEIKYAGSTLWKVNTVNSSGKPDLSETWQYFP